MLIEYIKNATEKLTNLYERIENLQNNVDVEEELGNSVLKLIGRYYKDYGEKLLDNLKNHPKDTIPIIINRFKKRIEELVNSKMEAEKTIKPLYEKYYTKSLDYRALRFKNAEKKNNNAKAFIKEITQRKRDKVSTTNLNILKGGVENFEFYITMNLKFFKENVIKTLKQIENNTNLDNGTKNDLELIEQRSNNSNLILKNINNIE